MGPALRLDSGTLSPLLKRLEAAGLVRRERSARDERQVTVSLTGPGRELRRRAAAVPFRIMAATGLDEPELVALHRSLERPTAALDAASGLG
nr:MarR family transcriptional regulator [Actinomadura sp. NBRC 104425]